MPQATYRGRNTLTLRERGYVVERSEAGTAKICTMLNVFTKFFAIPGLPPSECSMFEHSMYSIGRAQ